MVISLGRGADLHMVQLMPLPLIMSGLHKIQIGFTFLVPAHLGSLGQRQLNGCFVVVVCIIKLSLVDLSKVIPMVCDVYCLYTDMPDVVLLRCLHEIASEANVKIDYVVLGHRRRSEAYEMEANRVINLLKSAHLYESARAFAKAAHLSADSVTIDEVLMIISDFIMLHYITLQETLALASMARDDPPASSTVSSTVAAMRGKVGSEFET